MSPTISLKSHSTAQVQNAILNYLKLYKNLCNEKYINRSILIK